MKATIVLAVASALTLAGCASGPYGGYDRNVHYDDYRPYAYGSTYYGYPDVYYGYPGSIGGTFYYDRRDYDHERWNRHYRDRDHWQGRGRHEREDRRDRSDRFSREPLDTRHGEAGNEAGM